MTDADCEELLNAVVSAFVERNADVWNKALLECCLHGAVSLETAEEIQERVEAGK